MTLYLLILVLALFVLGSLGLSLLYLYESKLRPCKALPAPRPLALAYALAFAGTFSGSLLCVLLLPLGPLRRRASQPVKSEPHSQNKAPVVLVHGLYHNAASWLYLTSVLEKQGREVSVFTYPTRGSSPHSINIAFDAFMRRFDLCAKDRKPILVGHSLGGLIIRNWLRDPDTHCKVFGVIALGTPHMGSTCACLAIGDLAAAIAPGSAFIKDLTNAPSLVPALPCTAFASPVDSAVLPAAALLPPEGWTLRVTPPIGHFNMLFSPSVARMLTEELEGMELRKE